MIAEFTIIHDPLRPSVCTNLCGVCFRDKGKEKKIGCCSYQPEFCLFDLVFLYAHYPEIYRLLLEKGTIIDGYNGLMIEMTSTLNRCPFVGDAGCVLPRDAMTPLCRMYICREAALFAPAKVEATFDGYFSGREYQLNQMLNSMLPKQEGLTASELHGFIEASAPLIQTLITDLERSQPVREAFAQEIDVDDFGSLNRAIKP